MIHRKESNMTFFQFATTAFFALVGVICLALAAAVVYILYGVVVGLYREFKKKGGGKHGGRHERE